MQNIISKLKPFIKKILRVLFKSFLLLVGFIILSIITIFIVWHIFEYTYPEYLGSYDVGKGLYMVDGEGCGFCLLQGDVFQGKTCYGGVKIIDTLSYPMRMYNYIYVSEYVSEYGYDKDWILAKTNVYNDSDKTMCNKYYIIDKRPITKETHYDTIRNKYVYGYTDSLEFAKICQEKHIKVQINQNRYRFNESFLNGYTKK